MYGPLLAACGGRFKTRRCGYKRGRTVGRAHGRSTHGATYATELWVAVWPSRLQLPIYTRLSRGRRGARSAEQIVTVRCAWQGSRYLSYVVSKRIFDACASWLGVTAAKWDPQDAELGARQQVLLCSAAVGHYKPAATCEGARRHGGSACCSHVLPDRGAGPRLQCVPVRGVWQWGRSSLQCSAESEGVIWPRPGGRQGRSACIQVSHV